MCSAECLSRSDCSVRRFVELLCVGVCTCLLPLSSVAQPPLSANRADIGKLQIATAEVRGEQQCPTLVRFRANVEAATTGVIRYRLRSGDGELTPYFSVAMRAGESRDIVHLHRVGDPGAGEPVGYMQIEVETSKGTRTARASYRIACIDASKETRNIGLLSANLQQEREAGAESGENLRDRLDEYLRRRGYSSEATGDSSRVRSYMKLREMRIRQRKPHVKQGWLSPGSKDTLAPGTTDASQCAWSSTGPTNINGRVTHIAIDPTNNQRIFVTTVGGVWRSIDGGRRWQRVSDDFLSTVLASVAINPANPAEVFIGAGDPNYHGAWRGGIGIWRSTANGDPGSWAKVSPAALDNQVIYRIRIDPAAPNAVYAATSAGVYMGTRSGPNITFARLAAFDANTNDIAVDFSVTPRLVYAGVRAASATFARGIWKFDGTTWNQRNTGIPTVSSRAIVLALAASNTSVLYAKVESSDGHSQGVYRTATAGETPGGGGNAWTATSSALDDSCAGTFCYSWYNSTIEVDPADANTVWAGGLSIWRTTNGGTTWTNVWGGADVNFPLGVHADHHAVAFDPANSKTVYVGDDGGLFRATNTNAVTWRWNNISHGILVTEFYRSTSQQSLAGIAAGGTQDNGTIVTFGNRTWYQPGGCDGNDVGIDAANASTLYANCNGGLYELTNPVPGTVGGGTQATWSLPAGVAIASPLMTDPGVAGAALSAGYTTGPGPTPGSTIKTWNLYRTTDGLNWTGVGPTLAAGTQISAIGIAPSSTFQTYYVGVSGGVIWRTTNSGTNWTSASTGLPAGAWVNAVAIDFTDPARAIAATNSGVFLTTNTGAAWTGIGGSGAGALPTNAITGAVFDPNVANGVFLVTDVGVFRGTITPASGSTPATAAWTPFDEGLPDGLDVNDVWVNRTTGVLKIGTMGHGSFQRDIRPGITCSAAQTVVRDNVNDRGIAPSPSGVPDPEHPIPDPARPGFYMPDNTGAGRLYWWKSTDVRIDVPATAPIRNQIASADHVEVETCPILLSTCPPGTILDQYPQRGRTARVYAQVGNVGLQPATSVRVIALFADASAGLPPLPNDFWTTTFPAGSTPCGALNTGTGWRLAEPGNPCRTIPVINPDVPEVVKFDWSVPVGQAEHSCILIISETASDPLDPAIRSTNQLALSQLVPNNRQISLRNLHVIDATSPAGGASQGMEPMNVSNMSRELKYVELTISRVDFGKDAVVGLLLPTTRQVTVKGAVLARAQLNAMQRRTAEGLKLNPDAFYRVTDTREATLLLPIPPGQTWQVGIVYDRGKTNRMTSPQLSVMARQGDRVIGGNTYIFRPQSRIRK